nr:LptA/OstA family protein [Campylobacter hepaticus]
MNFYSDENKGESILSGNVEVIRGDDILNSEKLIIYTDKNRKPIRYEAMQNARFKIILKDKTYKGSGDKFIYNVVQDVYEINGNAYINELSSNQKLYGDKIVIDRKANIYRVESKDQKPARFVFELKDK